MVTLKALIGTGTVVLMAVATAAAQGSPAADAEQARAQAELIRSRQAISTMEAVLQRAVSNGAEMVMAQVRTVMPTGRPWLSNTPRVSGVRLPGYGVLFTVQVPDLQLPFMWDLVVRPNQNRDASVAMMVQQMKTQLMDMPSGPARSQLLQQVSQLELSLAAGTARADSRGVTAASIKPENERATDRIDPRVVDDPEAAYTREVKAALIDAMLINSQPLSIAPDEYLTIAASDDVPTNPRAPGDSIDASTWVMRVKGSVLAALRAQTITREEAEKQVDVTEQ